MIPKIIHQTAPSNVDNWHPLWHKCQQSWISNFNDFEYKLWNDEQIDELVRNSFPEYWNMYNNFPIHVLKIDFIRLCLLYKYGGIYADMDYYCYSNFYDELTDDVYLVENPFGNDPIENSLMCSVPNHPFWIECMELVKERYEYIKKKFPERLDYTKVISEDLNFGLKLRPHLVMYITGTNHISSAFRTTNLKVSTFPGVLYNNNDISYHPAYKTKHIHTGIWGKESIKVFHSGRGYDRTLRNIPVDQFDFYIDYSEGDFLKKDYIDFDKNNSDIKLNLGITHFYE